MCNTVILNNSEPKSLTDYVYMSFLLLSKEDKLSLFPKLCSEMFRVQLNASNFDDFIFAEDKSLDNYVETVTCPNDKTHDIVKNGKDRNGRQRFKCNICNQTFFAAKHTLSSNVTQDVAVWYRFVSGMLKQESIESLANACSISSATASNWQLRVFEAIRVLEDDVKLSGVVAADDTFFDYSLKGNHADNFIMPRKPRKRGHQNTVKNRNDNSICVLCAIDSENRSFSKITGFGNPSSKRTLKGFENKLTNAVDVLVTDGAKTFGKTVEKYNIPRWERRPSKQHGKKRVPDVSSEFHIQKVNAYHKKLKKFIANYNGVSSRRLPGYLLIFDFLQNHKGEEMECMCGKIISVMALPSEETSYAELNAKYIIPVSNGSETETWERLVPKKEQKIYIDWNNRVPIAEIVNKYKINRRKIYTIKDKVQRLKLHDKIISSDSSEPNRKSGRISEKSIKIYTEYVFSEMTQTALAAKYNMTSQGVSKIINKLQNRPEVSHLPKRKPKSLQKKATKPNTSERDTHIYYMFKFMYSEGVHLNDIYEQIAPRFSLSPKAIQSIILKKRKNDKHATFKYHWKDVRKNMSHAEFKAYIKKRDIQLYEEYMKLYDSQLFEKTKDLFTYISEKYNLSCSHCQLIIRTQRKLKQQEQAQEQELSNAS